MEVSRKEPGSLQSFVERRNKLLFGFIKNYNSKNTQESYIRDLKKFLKFLFDKFQITEFRAEHAHVVAYKDQLISEEYGKSSINRMIASASAYFDYLYQEGHRKDNPFHRVKRFKENPEGTTQAVALDDLEYITTLIEQGSDTGLLRMAIVRTLFNSGMRTSALCNLKLSSIERTSSGVLLNVHDKGGKVSKIPLGEKTATAIYAYLARRIELCGPLMQEDYLFVSFSRNAKEKMNRRSIHYIFSEIFEILEHQKISPHSARATFISQVIAKEGLLMAQYRANHSNAQSTVKYSRLNKPNNPIELI